MRVQAGKTAEVRQRDRVISQIVPATPHSERPVLPNFAALRREILGDRVFPGADILLKERGRP